MQPMTACYYSLPILYILLFSFSSFCFASVRSLSYNDDETEIESTTEESWQSNDDEYIDESKLHQTSYQHEQTLLANIYAPHRNYISVHDDRIQPSNFSYFTFNSPGTYRFILISLRGDADLYISTRDKHVTYTNYEFSSCTCGIDEVLIDPYMKRPIYVGVYGYSQYQTSYYRLLVELVDSTNPIGETISEQSDDDKSTQKHTTSHMNKKKSQVVVEGGEDRQHLLWNIFVWLLNFLVEVLT